MLKYNFLLLTLIIISSTPVFADTAWKGNIELGFVKTDGNTETETLNTKAKAETDRDIWRHIINFEALRSSDQGISTAEHYYLDGQSNYKLVGKNFLFIFLSYEDDRFSGYDYRLTEAVGYGRRVIDKNNMTLDLEIGPGARQSKVETTGKEENEVMLRGAAKYSWKISEYSKFTEDFTIDGGEDVTVTKSVTALTSKINSSLATKLTYTIKNTSDVPPGIEKTDSELAITLVYGL